MNSRYPARAVVGAALLIACMGPAFADPADSVELPSPEALEQMLHLLETQALYRDRVDWNDVRARLAAAGDDRAQQRRVLDEAATRSSRGHGRWISPSQQRERSGRAQRLNAGQGAALAESPAVDARIGVLKVGPFVEDLQRSEQERHDARKAYALALQQRIVDLDDGTRCAWVVDAGSNGGGNMWPMLLGLLPLLRGTPDAQGALIGAFRSADGLQWWRQGEGEVRQDGTQGLRSRQAAYRLRAGSAPVAVLIGARTASSGEAVALAFRGQAGSRSFGQPSAGFSTGNRPVTLVDGTTLLLTHNVMADRNGQGDGAKLQPDETTATGPATLAAAQAWLLAQPACKDG
ncbi:S41 family peptidase [Stenotrophomonas sp. PFBMAA-4]|uniref:S41 family peptidase n=1 Tax=Stenotrophomonas sp. PFBMAA-4 TaxID=3043301 RepID=UPI0024B4ADD3|nr:S41 family peptidase [Stenotrophomonas sp. PFBMAA-4]MDI9275207.1 S41 family peptidase [Stenotrophomonas sp. PFBMAA-4]